MHDSAYPLYGAHRAAATGPARQRANPWRVDLRLDPFSRQSRHCIKGERRSREARWRIPKKMILPYMILLTLSPAVIDSRYRTRTAVACS